MKKIDSVCVKQIATAMSKGKKWYQLGLMRWNWYEEQLKMVFFFVMCKKNIYPSHVNNIQIEKYLLLMTANGFNRAKYVVFNCKQIAHTLNCARVSESKLGARAHVSTWFSTHTKKNTRRNTDSIFAIKRLNGRQQKTLNAMWNDSQCLFKIWFLFQFFTLRNNQK